MSDKTVFQRRFLVKAPLEWFARAKIRTVKRIDTTSNYLEAMDQPYLRIREHIIRHTDGFTRAEWSFADRKNLLSKDFIDERLISKTYYDDRMRSSKKWKLPVNKMKYIIDFNFKQFELNVYREHLDGLYTLGITFSRSYIPTDGILFPPYFEIKEEITNNYKYDEVELAALVPGTINSLLGK